MVECDEFALRLSLCEQPHLGQSIRVDRGFTLSGFLSPGGMNKNINSTLNNNRQKTRYRASYGCCVLVTAWLRSRGLSSIAWTRPLFPVNLATTWSIQAHPRCTPGLAPLRGACGTATLFCSLSTRPELHSHVWPCCCLALPICPCLQTVNCHDVSIFSTVMQLFDVPLCHVLWTWGCAYLNVQNASINFHIQRRLR